MNEEQEDQRRQRNKRIVSWVIVILMVFSVFGFYVGSADTTSIKYHGIKFTPTSQGVLATIDGVRYAFNYLPTQVEDIPVDSGITALLAQPILQVTYDPQSNYTQTLGGIQYFFQQGYGPQFNTYIIPGITTNTTFSFPIITCANATMAQPVLAFFEDNETRININGACIQARGARAEDFLRMTDNIVLRKLGVLP